MKRPLLPVVLAALLIYPALAVENPWVAKVDEAVALAQRDATVDNYVQALDTTYRADVWRKGARLAADAVKRWPDEERINAYAARALWRAGELKRAGELVERLAPTSDHHIALQMIVTTSLARGDRDRARRAARRLEDVKPRTATNLSTAFGVRLLTGETDGALDLIKAAAQLADPNNGYPEIYFAEESQGLPDYFAAIGTEPINQVAEYGSAPMVQMPMLRMAACDVIINGHGPYRMLLDTGGSVILSIDHEVAEEVGLETLGEASVRGVSGKDTSQQALADEVRIGDIVCRRVMVRAFAVRKAAAYACDGIIGTGMFADARMQMDYGNGRLVISASSAKAGPGERLDAWIISDGKLISTATVGGEPALAFLDSGADGILMSPAKMRELNPDQKLRRLSADAVGTGGLGVGAEDTPDFLLGPPVDVKLGSRVMSRIGGLGLDALDDLISPIIGVQTDVLIGMPAFRQTRSVTVDYPRCEVWMDWLPE